MDPGKVELIKSRMRDLIQVTTCSTELLTFLYDKGAINLQDVQKIDLQRRNPAQVEELYRILLTRENGFQMLLKGLRETKQDQALDILVEDNKQQVERARILDAVQKKAEQLLVGEEYEYRPQPSPPPLSKTNIKFEVYPPVALFTGRKAELDCLHEIVLRSEKAARITVISQMTSVSGLGGIGKTQLARQYIQEKGSEFSWNCIWLNADSEFSLTEGFRRLANDKLGISTKSANGKEKHIKSVVQEVYDFFEGEKAIFIFDSAERQAWLKTFLPFSAPRRSSLYILITSRDREWESGMEVMDLQVFTMEDAVAFVVKGLDFDEVDERLEKSIKQLVNRLQFFPLALTQAVSYIHEQQLMNCSYTILDYLTEFERMQLEMLSFEEFVSIENDYSKNYFHHLEDNN